MLTLCTRDRAFQCSSSGFEAIVDFTPAASCSNAKVLGSSTVPCDSSSRKNEFGFRDFGLDLCTRSGICGVLHHPATPAFFIRTLVFFSSQEYHQPTIFQ